MKNVKKALLVLIVLAGAGWLVSGLTSQPSLNPFRIVTCTIGIQGTAASITVQGVAARAACENLLSHPPGPSKTYEMTQQPTEPVVCEYTIYDQRFIVRDQGILKLVGNGICQELQAQQRRKP